MYTPMVPIRPEFNPYPDIITVAPNNAYLRSPGEVDLEFHATRESLMDVDEFRNFIRNVEMRFRSSKEYKAYKAYCIEYLGIRQCQAFGNITADDADLELHHNVLGLFDITLLITNHMINTVGIVTTYDVIEILIQEHWNNRVGVTFLSKTAHQLYTADPNGYLPPSMTFGRWWELLSAYRYGITYDIAYKVINYMKKYQSNNQTSLMDITLQDQILNFAHYNEYGVPPVECGYLPENIGEGSYSNYGY